MRIVDLITEDEWHPIRPHFLVDRVTRYRA